MSMAQQLEWAKLHPVMMALMLKYQPDHSLAGVYKAINDAKGVVKSSVLHDPAEVKRLMQDAARLFTLAFQPILKKLE